MRHDVGKPKCLVPLCHSDIMEIGTDDPSHCPEVAAPDSSSEAAVAARIRWAAATLRGRRLWQSQVQAEPSRRWSHQSNYDCRYRCSTGFACLRTAMSSITRPRTARAAASTAQGAAHLGTLA